MVVTAPVADVTAWVLVLEDKVLGLLTALFGVMIGCQPIPPLQSRLVLLAFLVGSIVTLSVAYTKTSLDVAVILLAPGFTFSSVLGYVGARSTSHLFNCSSLERPVERLVRLCCWGSSGLP